MQKLQNKDLFINQGLISGQWVDAQNKETFGVHNPASGDLLGEVANLGAVEIVHSIDVAKEAFVCWSALSAKQRQNILYKWNELILANQEDLATIMVYEQGKPFSEALAEVKYAASFVSWFGAEATRVHGSIMSDYAPMTQLQYTKEPVGVVGIVTPWNFPLAMITRKVAPALAAGCSVVIKPSELTPYSALALGKLAQEAGVLDGVCNIIPTTRAQEFGEIICASRKIAKISFTGSTKVGKILLAQGAQTVKKMSMELGGNAPFIVFEDAKIDNAVDALIATKFRNTGQTCVCANRIFVQESVHDEFVQKLKNKVEQFVVGEGFTQGVNQGPLINQDAVQKVQNHISQSVKNGATCVLGGKPHAKGGTFFEPTILTNVNADDIFSCEETFGPIAPISSFVSEEEVIECANNTPYGLASYFCTTDYQRIYRVNEQIQSGIVAINTGSFSNEFGPFGGIKESGLGREGSTLGIEEYLQIKYSLISYA